MANQDDIPRAKDREGGYISEEKALDDLKRAETELSNARELGDRRLSDLRKAERELEEARRPVFIFYIGKEKFELNARSLPALRSRRPTKTFPQATVLSSKAMATSRIG